MLRHLRRLQCSALCRAWAGRADAHRSQQQRTLASLAYHRAAQRHPCLPSTRQHPSASTLSPRRPLPTRTFQSLVCQAKKPKSAASPKQQPQRQQQQAADDGSLLPLTDDYADELDFDEDGQPFDQFDQDDDPFADDAEQLLSPDDSAPTIALGQVAWGEAALHACRDALAAPGMEGLDLYAFRVIAPRQRIDVRLDNLEDYYGSPSLDQVAAFSRVFYERLQAGVGAQLAGEIDVEVSSPGAEREIRVPADLERFQELPMKVEFVTEEGTQEAKVLALDAVDEGASTWRLADVKANAPGKGRKLSKKQREQVFEIGLERIRKVNLHIDY